MSKNRSPRPCCRVAACAILLAAPLTAGLAACGGPDPMSAPPQNASGALRVTTAGGPGGKVDPRRPVRIRTRHREDRITDVLLTDTLGRTVRGELSDDGRSWRSTGPLGAGVHYTVSVRTTGGDGRPGRSTSAFTTAPATHTLTARFGPRGSVFGTGQPITARLNRKVTDPAVRAAVERGLRVSSSPAVTGAWYWVDDRTLHYRPRSYWPAHTTVHAASTLEGAPLGHGLYGGSSTPLSFTTGDQVTAVVDAAAHRMTVTRNGKVLRTVPVTTGKPGFDTRNGSKVILSRQPDVRMSSLSIGIPAGSADSFDLEVRWAVRVTWSGEYVHAAPWSVGSQGVANVSHGCVGMSTDDAHWFFDTVLPGDVVRVVGSKGHRMAPFTNGFGDWNLTWPQWRKGSALRAPHSGQASPSAALSARLRPQEG